MATFYIKSSKGIYELTSTSNIKVTQPSRPTKHKLENGSTVADHIVNENITISFEGMISDIKSIAYDKYLGDSEQVTEPKGDSLTAVKTYVDSLRRLRDSKELFSVIYDPSRFEPANNCLVTNLSIERDASILSGYRVSLSFEQVRLAEKARFSVTREVQQNPDKTQGKTESSATNTKELGIENVRGSLGINTYKSAEQFFLGQQ